MTELQFILLLLWCFFGTLAAVVTIFHDSRDDFSDHIFKTILLFICYGPIGWCILPIIYFMVAIDLLIDILY